MYVLEDIEEKVKVKLWLEKTNNDTLALKARNNKGEVGTLALFHIDGVVYFPSGVEVAGVVTDGDGRIGNNLNKGF